MRDCQVPDVHLAQIEMCQTDFWRAPRHYGLPALPALPALPGLPALPARPALPALLVPPALPASCLPSISAFLAMPALPAVPALPAFPACPTCLSATPMPRKVDLVQTEMCQTSYCFPGTYREAYSFVRHLLSSVPTARKINVKSK